MGRSLKATGVDVGTNPEDVRVFESETPFPPTAHKWLGLAEVFGSAEVFVGKIIKLLIETMPLLTRTFS